MSKTNEIQEKKEMSTLIIKQEPKTPAKKTDVFADLMKYLNEIEELRGYYNKLKIKRNTLQSAHERMCAFGKKENKFEESDEQGFPYEIVVRGNNEYKRLDDLFTINKVETVTSFTSYLLKEINDLLAVFEADILEHSKKIKSSKKGARPLFYLIFALQIMHQSSNFSGWSHSFNFDATSRRS